jgi:hypothetical protein
MRITRSIAAVLCLPLLIAGCVTTGPAVSKSRRGNLQINVRFPRELPQPSADLYLDGLFIGNVSPDTPVIYARRGARTVRVEAAGCEAYERTITILGDPNHQVLDVNLRGNRGTQRGE